MVLTLRYVKITKSSAEITRKCFHFMHLCIKFMHRKIKTTLRCMEQFSACTYDTPLRIVQSSFPFRNADKPQMERSIYLPEIHKPENVFASQTNAVHRMTKHRKPSNRHNSPKFFQESRFFSEF